MSDRRYWLTRVTVEILSEEPFEFDDLSDVNYAISDGDCVGQITSEPSVAIEADAAHAWLLEAGSEPGFFNTAEEA